MNTAWLKTRQTKFTAYVTLYILVVVAILGALNFLANRYNKSVDTTSNKRFSLSDQTIKVVKGLKQDARITYFDKNSEFSHAKDLLDRYDNLSPKLKVDYIDPDKKPTIAKEKGVRNYGSIFVDVGDRHQEAKSLTEEDVTSALIRALKGGDRTTCFVTGSGEHGLDDTARSGYSQLKELIERNNYKTKTISLLEKPEIPKDCTIAIVGGPKFDYTEPAVNALKTYVEGGGRALFMVDPPVHLGKETTSDNAALVNLLSSWGVTPQKDLALDTTGVGQLFGFSEVVPLVTTYETHPIVRDLKGVATAFPLARTLEVKSGDKTTVEKLFSTGEGSYATPNLNSSEIRLDPKKDKHGPFVLGAAGTFNGTPPGRFVVVGSSNWASNSILRFNGNSDLFMNIMNWLSSDEDLISIRPKDPEDRRLQLNRRQVSSIFLLTVVFIPLMSVIAGVAVYWKRR